jgi:predicted PurR-regulated permease PerM
MWMIFMFPYLIPPIYGIETLQVFVKEPIFAVTLSLLNAIAGVVPMVPAPLLAVPTALHLWLSDPESDSVDATCFFLLHVYLWWVVAPDLYENMAKGLPYLAVSFSVAGGMVLLGMEGALLGPFALAGLVSMFKIFSSFLSPEVNLKLADAGKEDGRRLSHNRSTMG